MSQKPESNLAKPIKLPEKIVQAFAKQFQPLGQKSAGLPTRLLDYLLHGKSPEVLDELATICDAGEVMLLRACKVNHFQDWPLEKCGFFEKRWEPIEFYFRLSRIWEEASQIRASRQVLAGLPYEGRWLVPFLWEFQARSHNQWRRDNPLTAVTAEDIEQLFIWRGQPPEWLVRSGLYIAENQRRYRMIRSTASYYEGIPNMGAAYVRHKATVVEALQQKDHLAREETLELLGKFEETLEPYADVWVDCAVSSAKGMRERALLLIARKPEPALPHLQKKALEGNGSERAFAVECLAKVYGDSIRSFLDQTLKREKAKLGRETIETHLRNLRPSHPREPVKLAHSEPLSPNVPLTESAKEALRAGLNEFNEIVLPILAANAAAQQAAQQKWAAQPKYLQAAAKLAANRRTHFTKTEIEEVIRFLETYTLSNRDEFKALYLRFLRDDEKKISALCTKIASHPTWQLIHVTRWAIFLRGELDHPECIYITEGNEITAYKERGGVIPNLKDQVRMYEALGYETRDYALRFLSSFRYSGRPPVLQMSMEDALTYFRENLDVIEEVFEIDLKGEPPPRRHYLDDKQEMAFAILEALPEIPDAFIEPLWEFALSGKKKEKPYARKILNKLPDKEARIVETLGKGKSDLRISAAEWLGELNNPKLLPKLKEALAKEKQQAARNALRVAIDKLGGSQADSGLSGAIDLKALEAEMKALVAKGRPSSLNWLKFERLPKVTWKKGNKPVSSVILEGLIIQTIRFKNPEPGPELRRICAAMNASQREKMSEFIFKSWLQDDERERYTASKAFYEGRSLYHKEEKKNQNNPAWDANKSYHATQKLMLAKCEESSAASKGVFALIGACSSGSIAVPVYRYVKKWFGRRLHQGKALVQMLAHIDDVRAIQSLLALGYRFRTKGIRELAAEKCLLIAEKKGWTVDELADRTIPSAGFDDDGRMEFDYGKRRFVAKLLPNFAIRLEDEKEVEIENLPDARKDEDEEVVKEAKGDLSQARKDLKSIIKMQRERLYEAMCTRRTWKQPDWEEHLLKHPLAGFFCQRLVWQVVQGPHRSATFRPMPDRTLTDSDDETVTLSKEDSLALAHDLTVPKKASAAWLTHLTDYNVEPLWTQFGQPTIALSVGDKEKTEWTGFLGHMTTAFALAKVMSSRGYHRSSLIEENFFCEYRKHIAGLKLQVAIEFTGQILDEKPVDHPIALKSLSFLYNDPNPMSGSHHAIPLEKVPLVLFNECWNDLRTAASVGSGFDSEWEKKAAQ